MVAPQRCASRPSTPRGAPGTGVHGGYALALAAKLAQTEDASSPRALHGTFISPLLADQALDATVTDLRRGRSSADVRVELHASARRAVDVVATFDRRRAGPDFERFPAPKVLPPDACDDFALPVELVPFTSHIEVRPTNDARPLSGGSDPELTAWIRLVGPDLEPWQVVTVLLDPLPPRCTPRPLRLRPSPRPCCLSRSPTTPTAVTPSLGRWSGSGPTSPREAGP